jgi:hypothetical protein
MQVENGRPYAKAGAANLLTRLKYDALDLVVLTTRAAAHSAEHTDSGCQFAAARDVAALGSASRGDASGIRSGIRSGTAREEEEDAATEAATEEVIATVSRALRDARRSLELLLGKGVQAEPTSPQLRAKDLAVCFHEQRDFVSAQLGEVQQLLWNLAVFRAWSSLVIGQGLGRRQLACQLHAWASQAIEATQSVTLARALCWWCAVVRESQHEKARRREIITAAAEASADNYRIRTESCKLAMELRRQRRAHGVAAIHASLDRHLQAVLNAWSNQTRNSQQEDTHQRQLDISAAETAASCATMRMHFRRGTSVLRARSRALGLRAVLDGLHHTLHIVLYAWWCAVVLEARQKAGAMVQMGIAVADAPTEDRRELALLRSERAEHQASEARMKQEIDSLRSRIREVEQIAASRHAELLQAETNRLHALARLRTPVTPTSTHLEEIEARYTDALQAESPREEHSAEVRAQAEEVRTSLDTLNCQHAAAMKSHEPHAQAALPAQTSASEIRFSEIEAQNAAALSSPSGGFGNPSPNIDAFGCM